MTAYNLGMAIIAEGATERVFYSEYVLHVARKGGCSVTQFEEVDETGYVLANNGGTVLVKIHDVGTVSQIPNAGRWFQRMCFARHATTPWCVFLAYDTDEYNSPISKFREGDWALLRRDLSDASEVIDLAAEADIEDVMLCDLSSVLNFLGLPPTCPLPCGGKGKSKMKKLFREVAPYNAYHSGERARSLIQALDFTVIASSSPVPLNRIDEMIAEVLSVV